VLQFAAVALWVACTRAGGPCLDPRRVGLAQWLFGIAAVAYGQSLNAGTFSAIGRAGVYYGCKLGVSVPWVTGWPFDAVAHPQYVGSVLSVWGLTALLWGQVPGAALGALAAFWTSLYVVTGAHEQYL
jgi:methylene-fatty-acyl-phospholipid synthase